MSISNIEAKTTSFESPEVGADMARVIGVIDIGTQETTAFDSQDIVLKHQVVIKLELPNQKDSKGRTFTMDKWFPVSLHEKSGFRKFIDVLGISDVTGFNAKSLIGKTVQVDVTENETTGRVGIKAFAKLMKGIVVPEMISNPIYFSIEGFQPFSSAEFKNLPEYLQKTVMKSKEFKKFESSPIDESPADEVQEDAPETMGPPATVATPQVQATVQAAKAPAPAPVSTPVEDIYIEDIPF